VQRNRVEQDARLAGHALRLRQHGREIETGPFMPGVNYPELLATTIVSGAVGR
jgi:hypothetical protein